MDRRCKKFAKKFSLCHADCIIPLSLTLDMSNAVWSNNPDLKYPSFTPSGWKDIGIWKFEFMANTQFFSYLIVGKNKDWKNLHFFTKI